MIAWAVFAVVVLGAVAIFVGELSGITRTKPAVVLGVLVLTMFLLSR